MDKYPEHTKVKKLPEESQAIYKFLDYLESRDVYLSKYHNLILDEVDNPENLVLEFYGVDLDKLGKENVIMLKELQEKQTKRWEQEGLK